jgi:hypothetical protein
MSVLLVGWILRAQKDMDNAECTLCESVLTKPGSIGRWINFLHLVLSIAAEWCGNDTHMLDRYLGDISFWEYSGAPQ